MVNTPQCLNAVGRHAVASAVFGFAGVALAAAPDTTTPIHHVVVIYQENVSFDHYFATYPLALNPEGEPVFHPAPETPSVNGLSGPLMTHNPNSGAPFRLPRSHAATCDQDHAYRDEQRAYNAGLVDRAVENEGTGTIKKYGNITCDHLDVMGYFDGNTVTALWNYAQRFAMSDNFYGTTFGPSTVGALNLIAGQTHGATGDCAGTAGCKADAESLSTINGGVESVEITGRTIIGDPQPAGDDCSFRERATMTGPNIGEALSLKKVTWGFFQGGFKPSSRDPDGRPHCDTSHTGSSGATTKDYIPHHQPFQYYASTANPRHEPPSRPELIGHNEDAANHQYDLSDFWAAAKHSSLPAVSFLKARAYQDGHAGYSDPLKEQCFLVETINRLQRLPAWHSMAIVIAYDDSDGWYDHAMPPIVRGSISDQDALTADGRCGQAAPDGVVGRCGYGPRLPLLVLSPWSRRNFVDHRALDQASILRFIEDNWRLERLGGGSADAEAGDLRPMFDFKVRPHDAVLLLDPVTGEHASRAGARCTDSEPEGSQ